MSSYRPMIVSRGECLGMRGVRQAKKGVREGSTCRGCVCRGCSLSGLRAGQEGREARVDEGGKSLVTWCHAACKAYLAGICLLARSCLSHNLYACLCVCVCVCGFVCVYVYM